jgi:four helix bundle protein
MAITRFEDLEVWQDAATLAVEIYSMSKNGSFDEDFGLRDQIRRSAVSVAANIAEGKERETVPELIRYLYIAKGSSGELRSHLMIAQRIGYIEQDCAKNLRQKVETNKRSTWRLDQNSQEAIAVLS